MFIVRLSEANLLLALSKVDAWLVEREYLVNFEVNLPLKLLSALTMTSLSCFASMWWDHLNHNYGKNQSPFGSLPAVWAEGRSAVRHRPQVPYPGCSWDPQQLVWDTAVPPPEPGTAERRNLLEASVQQLTPFAAAHPGGCKARGTRASSGLKMLVVYFQ